VEKPGNRKRTLARNTNRSDPVQGVLARVRNSLQLFGLQLADEVKRLVVETVYNVKRSKGKTTFEVKARAIYEANALPELVTDVLGQYVDVVKECFTGSYRMRVAMEFLRGIVFGLLEGLIPFEDFTKSDIFWGVVDRFQDVVDEAFAYFQRNFDQGDYEYLVEQKDQTDAFE
jgi:hypothetical protein